AGALERLVDIGNNRAGLVNRKIVVSEDRDSVERMQRQVFRHAHHGLEVVEGVGDVLVGEDKPDDIDEGAARKAIHNGIRHLVSFCSTLRSIASMPERSGPCSMACSRVSSRSASQCGSSARSCGALRGWMSS